MASSRGDLHTSIGLLILRVGVGGYMLTHGLPKLQMIFKGQFAEFPDPIGLGAPVSLVATTGAEFFCALLVVLGLATRIAAAPIVFTMGVAALIVQSQDPWIASAEGPSKEPAMLFLIPMLALIFTGGGRFSLDATLIPRIRANRAARKAVAKQS
jgi:putative oxidoreductase